MFKQIILPENIEGLAPVRINEVLYQTIPFKAKIEDQRLHGINTYLARGVGPLTFILDKFIALEELVSVETDPPAVSVKEGKIVVGDFVLDVSYMRGLIHQSTKILSCCHTVTLQKRKSLLHQYIGKKYHYLTKPTNPVSSELLGPGVEQKIADCNKLNEAARKIGLPGAFSRGCSWKAHGGASCGGGRGSLHGNNIHPCASESCDFYKHDDYGHDHGSRSGFHTQGDTSKQARNFRQRPSNRHWMSKKK